MAKTQLLSSEEIAFAARLLQGGELVAFPTETVYGLGACLFQPEAIVSLFKVKGRPSDNPLIVHVSSRAQVEEIAEEIPELFDRLASSFFPGPLTVVLKRRSSVPSLVSAGLGSIALRMPSHPIALKLIELVGQPLVAPSANLSGRPSATQPKHVLEDFEGKIAAVVDGGKTQLGIESTVISLLGAVPVLLRPGSITEEEIEQVLGCFIETASMDPLAPVLSPGMKYRHYAPRAQVRVFDRLSELRIYVDAMPLQNAQRMLLAPDYIQGFPAALEQRLLSAQEFYSLLREADEKEVHEILILCDDALKRDAALMNRLMRASSQSIPLVLSR